MTPADDVHIHQTADSDIKTPAGPPSSLTWTSCLSPGQSDGPDLFSPQQQVFRVHVPPQSGRQEEAADSL